MKADIRASLDQYFPRYTEFSPAVPIWCLTPHRGGCMHRFFDTSPLSPSGRYLACTRLLQEERPPVPGEEAEIVVVDLANGEEKCVARTAGFEGQMGANLNWGKDDEILLYNDVNTQTWDVHCVRLHWPSGEKFRFGRGIYQASPDGRYVLCTNPRSMRRTQSGYGVVVPDEQVPSNYGLSNEDGLFLADSETGECRLLISIREAVERTAPKEELPMYDDWENYFFHCKWSPDGERVLFSLRRFPKGTEKRFDTLHQREVMVKYDVFTMRPDGSELFNAVNAEQWDKGGHHINWNPDNHRLSMNLNIEHTGMRFVEVDRDGSKLGKILESPGGSGHPSIHPSGKFLVTDTYVFEKFAFGDGTTPLRIVSLPTGKESLLARIRSETAVQKEHVSLRLDPHPTWDRTWRYVIFDACPDNTRRVFLADMESVIAAESAPVLLADGAKLIRRRDLLQGGDSRYAPALAQLCVEADEACAEGPWSVLGKTQTPPSGDKHDYMSVGPYWWPNPKTPDGLPYIRKDGEVNPERGNYDNVGLAKTAGNSLTLALAWFYSAKGEYAEQAANLLRNWFITPETRMNPNLNYGQAIPGRCDGRGIGIIDTSCLVSAVEAALLLEASSVWTAEDAQALRQWFREYLHWLQTSELGREEERTSNNHAVWYDVQVATFAFYTGQKELAKKVIQTAKDRRIATQIEPDGRQPHELARTNSWGYSVMNLIAFFHLATLGEQVGLDLWNYSSPDGRGIREALEFLLPTALGERGWIYEQIHTLKPQALGPLLRRGANAYGEPAYEAAFEQVMGEEGSNSRLQLLYPSE